MRISDVEECAQGLGTGGVGDGESDRCDEHWRESESERKTLKDPTYVAWGRGGDLLKGGSD